MALVQGTDPIAASLTFRDNNANTAQMGFYLPNALTLITMIERLNDIRDAAAPLSNASLIGGSITIPLTEDAIVAATPESEVERKLVLIGATSSKRQKPRFFLPSPVFSIEQVNTDEVSLVNPLVDALATVLEAGALLPGNGAVSINGLDILSFTRAYIAHYNRRVG